MVMVVVVKTDCTRYMQGPKTWMYIIAKKNPLKNPVVCSSTSKFAVYVDTFKTDIGKLTITKNGFQAELSL